MSGYSATSRDSVRLADSSSMRTSLEIYQVNSGKYPLPDQNGYFEIDSETLWWQGKFNGTVIDNLSRNFSEAPLDPLSEKTYTYSVAGNKNEYQLLVLLENDDTALSTINQTNAATQSRTPKVSGTYNGLYVKTATKFYALPSILTALDYNSGANALTGTMMKSMIVNGYDNVPNEGNIKYVTGALDIPETVYSTGTVSSTDGNGSKASVVRMLQEAYSGSNLSNDGIYKYITDLDENDEELLAGVLDTVVLGNVADVAITTSTEVVLSDTTPPTGGSMIINNNDASTSSTSVTLNVTCPTDAAGSTPIEIAYGNTPNPNNWTTCINSISHSSTSGVGIKTVYYKFRDNLGNETIEASDSITLSLVVTRKDENGLSHLNGIISEYESKVYRCEDRYGTIIMSKGRDYVDCYANWVIEYTDNTTHKCYLWHWGSDTVGYLYTGDPNGNPNRIMYSTTDVGLSERVSSCN